MKISEAAAASGCHLETIRYYERSGLVSPPKRTHSGYRSYTPADVDRLRFISRGRELGFSLEEIRSLLRLDDDPTMSCRDVDAMAAVAAPHAEDPDAVAAAVTDLLLGWLRRPEVVRTQAELALEAARRPELMAVFDPWRQGLVRVVEELVRCTGRDDPALRAAVAACPFHFKGEPLTITCSAGLTAFADNERSDQVFERADQALYQAKREGRDRLIVA